MLAFVSSKGRRPGFDHNILGETTTGTGEGYSWSWGPPLVVVVAGAGAESRSGVLRWEKVGEVNGRQDKHHRL